MPGKDTPEEPLASKRHFPSAFERRLDALVADWVGEDAAHGVLGKMHRQPKKVGFSVDKFLAQIRQDEEVLLETITSSWKEVVGQQTSTQLMPLEIKDGVLMVSAMNQTYRFVFQSPQMKAPIIERLKDLTDDRVQDFRIVAQGRR